MGKGRGMYVWRKNRPLIPLKPMDPEAERRYWERRAVERDSRRKCAENNAVIIDGLGEPEMSKLRRLMRGKNHD